MSSKAIRAVIRDRYDEVLLVRGVGKERKKWNLLGKDVQLDDELKKDELREIIKKYLNIDVKIHEKNEHVIDSDKMTEYIVYYAEPSDDLIIPGNEIWAAGWFTRDEVKWHWDNIDDEAKMLLVAVGYIKNGKVNPPDDD